MSLSLSIAIITFLLLCLSLYFNIKLGLTILKIEDAVTQCLDIVDERYESVSKILEIPIFFDSVEVRRVLEDIKITKTSLLVIANSLSDIQEEKAENREVI